MNGSQRRAAQLRQETDRLDRCWAAWPASRSDWRGYTGLAASQAMRAPTRPARLRWKPRAGWRRWCRGEVAAVSVASAPKSLPLLAFKDGSGTPKSLADWRGRTVLLNLWATWCVPCRKEMPALDALQAKLGGADFEVVSINIDTRDTDKPKDWLKNAGVNTLAYYADNSAKVFQDLKAIGKAFGMPTTLIVDPNGCELASLAGPAEWASGDALKLVTAALRNKPSRVTR